MSELRQRFAELETDLRFNAMQIAADERFSYPTATVVENAPLALIQLEMKTRYHTTNRIADRIREILGEVTND